VRKQSAGRASALPTAFIYSLSLSRPGKEMETSDEGGTLRATITGAHHVRLFKAAVTFLSKLGKS